MLLWKNLQLTTVLCNFCKYNLLQDLCLDFLVLKQTEESIVQTIVTSTCIISVKAELVYLAQNNLN